MTSSHARVRLHQMPFRAEVSAKSPVGRLLAEKCGAGANDVAKACSRLHVSGSKADAESAFDQLPLQLQTAKRSLAAAQVLGSCCPVDVQRYVVESLQLCAQLQTEFWWPGGTTDGMVAWSHQGRFETEGRYVTQIAQYGGGCGGGGWEEQVWVPGLVETWEEQLSAESDGNLTYRYKRSGRDPLIAHGRWKRSADQTSLCRRCAALGSPCSLHDDCTLVCSWESWKGLPNQLDLNAPLISLRYQCARHSIVDSSR